MLHELHFLKWGGSKENYFSFRYICIWKKKTYFKVKYFADIKQNKFF